MRFLSFPSLSRLISQVLLANLLLFIPVIAFPQTSPQGPPPQSKALDSAERTRIVQALGKLLRDNYVFPDLANQTATALEAKAVNGTYNADTTPQSLADSLTRDLQELTHDKHLRVFPEGPGDHPPGAPDDAARAAFERRGRHDNFGFVRVERLSGNVGYLDLRMFAPPKFAGSTAVAAMNFLSGTDAVIIDLRQNGGGDPDMIQLISTYFFRDSTHLNDLYWREGNRTQQFWTLPYVPGRMMPDVPLFVLTSSQTFSGAEEFANNMKMLKRGRIVGETTGGGANPGASFPLPANMGVFVPRGRAVNPISGKNWEGTGVEPDEKVPASDALDVAYSEALTKIKNSATEPISKNEAAWALEGVSFHKVAVTLTADQLQKYAGTYGPRRIFVEGGKLYLQDGSNLKVLLIPHSGNSFELQGVEYMRLHFVANDHGDITTLIARFDDGEEESSPRE